MKAIALLGLCLIFAAHGKPISPLKAGSAKKLGNLSPSGIVRQKRADVEGQISTTYSSELSANSGVFYRLYGYTDDFYYYQAIQVATLTSGTYIFTSESELDTMGFFYDNSFDPSEPSLNLISDDDDGDGNLQFRIEVFLEAGKTYVLVLTTHGEGETGSFLVSAAGPGAVDLMSITPATSRPILPVTEAPAPTASTSFSSELSPASAIFYRVDGDPATNYYYQAIQVTVSTSGTYTLTSDSNLDTIGYFYDTSFDPSVPTKNLITDDDDDGDIHLQFRIESYLQAGHIYILVVTTHGGFEIGGFSVSASGPDTASLTPITPATSQPIVPVVTQPTVVSSLTSELSPTSQIFNRPDGDQEFNYYYQAIEIVVPTSGTYTFTSVSELDTMGFLYQNSFEPSNPTANLITDDDDGDSNMQFLIEAFLEAGQTYILVVTTHGDAETGGFSINTSGPASVNLKSNTQ